MFTLTTSTGRRETIGSLIARYPDLYAADESGFEVNPQDMLDDPHFQARDAIIAVPHPRWGEVKMQNVFPKLSATPGSVRRRAPETIGQDNADVYGEMLGLDEAALADLQARGII